MKKMNNNRLLGWLVVIVGIITFIMSLPTLQSTWLGFTSSSFEHSLIYIAIGYLIMNINYEPLETKR